MRRAAALFALGLTLAASAAAAQASAGAGAGQAVGVDVVTSADADNTDIAKYGLDYDWRYAGPDQRQGVRLEIARYTPLGQTTTQDLRAYYRFADKDRGWTWNGQLGTDGHTALAAFDAHDEGRFRQEYFLERDVVETPQGLRRRLYYTFGGGAVDVPVAASDNLNLLAAAQDFTGRNLRLHARATYVHVLKADWGLTGQLRVRAFTSSAPGEFDYFSPRWYAQVLPVLQLRRYRAGWRYTVAGGVGAQLQTGMGWRQARWVSAQVTSPPTRGGWAFDAAATYSNTPVAAGYTYDYRQLSVGVVRAF